MSETRRPAAERLDLGPFKGSDRPDNIAVFPDNSTQITWTSPGSRVAFDETEILLNPDISEVHRAVGYRLLQPDRSTVALIYTNEAVVARRYSQDRTLTSERVYTRKGINRDYSVPRVVALGQELSLLSGTYTGRLAVVNEVTKDDPLMTGRDVAVYFLHGWRGIVGDPYKDIPDSVIPRPNNVLSSLDRAEYSLNVAIGKVGIIAVQNHGVVLR